MQYDLYGKNTSARISDNDVVKLYLQTREPAYFSLLYDRYSGKVYRKCISLLKDEGMAQDATQGIFMKIFINLAKFSGKSKFSTWLYSVTYNYCIDVIRRTKKEKNIFSDEIESVPELIEEVDDKELLQMKVSRLKKVLDNIPSGDKAILLMKYQQDMSIKEIAEILDKTENAIKMKIKRAKHKAKLVYSRLFPSTK